jgi:uncharacterized protein YjiS (DUF1127 family)
MNLSDDTYLISGNPQRIASDAGKFLSAMLARLHRIGTSWTERRARAREMGDLYRFTDRELRDLGLSRSDLWAIKRGTFHRE